MTDKYLMDTSELSSLNAYQCIKQLYMGLLASAAVETVLSQWNDILTASFKTDQRPFRNDAVLAYATMMI